jgi:hypothetical protein
MLAYGMPGDAQDGYLRMAESTIIAILIPMQFEINDH